ncbi:unnamed protein product [Dibothriocephalus latus]|uniref:Uncharacterized protein n=1 Tax=Dibothriocephalus latus TaxID=60516 RepID=A0A3P7N6U9_DIBLA|nr:unnamed protein product [Dibothriocephalus latus]
MLFYAFPYLSRLDSSFSSQTHKIQLGAFNLSAQRQAVTLPVRIEHVMGAPTDTCHALATSSLAEFTRLSASGPIERLKKLSQQPTLSAMGLMLGKWLPHYTSFFF